MGARAGATGRVYGGKGWDNGKGNSGNSTGKGGGGKGWGKGKCKYSGLHDLGFDLWSGGEDQSQRQWNYGDGGDWNGIRSLGFFGPAHVDHVRHVDEHAPIVSAATVDGLAPISVPLPSTVSAASGYKSASASSHSRVSAFSEGANIAEPPPWRKDAGTRVPIEDLIHDPSNILKFGTCQSRTHYAHARAWPCRTIREPFVNMLSGGPAHCGRCPARAGAARV